VSILIWYLMLILNADVLASKFIIGSICYLVVDYIFV